VVSKDGIVTFWNYGAERLYGRIGSEVLGQPIGRLKLDGTAGERLLERFAPASHGDTSAEEVFSVRDGTSRIIRLKVHPLAANQDQEDGVICMAYDVTELYRAVENMRVAEERQEQANTRYRETIAQLRASKEELEEVDEELRSANQELHTTNAELQSTNEELEAMNEELQLTRGELEAQGQLSARKPQPDTANLLKEAVMRATAIAVIGLDEHGRVNLCNPGAARLFNCPESQMLRRSIQRLSLAPLPEPVSISIKRSVSQKLPLSLETFDCTIGARQVELSCRLTPLTGEGGPGGALLIIEPVHGPAAGLSWR
jgi:two-component system, chemotaxis family, CheB/CheR fusion protein